MERDHLVFLREASEALSVLSGDDTDAFLARIVGLLTRHIRADVASIYLYDKATGDLVLRATRGLAPESVGHVHLRLGEGLVGHVLETLEPTCEKAASRNPRFKHFAGINEEPYESFLAVPLHRGAERLGVLVAQRREADYFGSRDVMALQALASQLANALENARLLNREPALMEGEACLPRQVTGRVVSPGLAGGPLVHIDSVHAHRRLAAGPFVRRYSLDDLQAALEATDAELGALERRFAKELPEMAALIFSAHQMMLMDVQFAGAIVKRVDAGENPPDAVVAVARDCMERFEANPDPYIRDKSADMEDLAARLLSRLLGTDDTHSNPRSRAGRVAFAPDLYPSDVVELYAQDARGIVLGHGGDTSHVVLLIRSLGIPALIVDNPDLFELEEGTPVLLDAETGSLCIDPPKSLLERLLERQEPQRVPKGPPMKPETRTRDGTRVHLMANINLLGEAPQARRLKAEGVGLYRSEFPFLLRPAFPSEEEQVVIYTRLIQEMQGRPVTVRTLDLGGDKASRHHLALEEENPQLGLRSIRYSLRHPEIFHQQLRAILRGAAGAHRLRVMFPMIGGLDEWRAAREAARKAQASLVLDGLPHYADPELGIMVELPSTVALMEELADEADFFSIGTNDFVQYLLGVDRGNREVAEFYRPGHPAVLRSIHRVVRVAVRRQRDVSVCGEMAHEPLFLPFFLGIGVRTFSVAPRFLGPLQAAIAGTDLAEAKTLARRVLRCVDFQSVDETLARWTRLQDAADAGLGDGSGGLG